MLRLIQVQYAIYERFIIAFFAAYIFLFIWGWLINGVLLKNIYAESARLWRPENGIAGIIEMIIVGAMVGAIYKPAPARSSSQ